MNLLIDSSPEETYRLLMDYFDGRHLKVKTSDSPLCIKAAFGSWTDMVLDNAKGEVTARIVKRNGGSGVSLDFDFALEYYPALLLTVAGFVATYMLYDLMRVSSMWALFVMLIEVVVVWGIVVYSISLTKRKLKEELDMLIQSQSTRKQK